MLASSGSTLSYIDGDGTRVNLASNGMFDSASGWTLGGGWSIAAGKAVHVGPDASVLSQAITLESGKAYRVSFTISGMTAGNITAGLSGGTDVLTPTISADETVFVRLTAQSGNSGFAFNASAAFDGSVDGFTLYAETPASVDAGDWDYWIEPLNSENIAGPISGPFTTTIY